MQRMVGPQGLYHNDSRDFWCVFLANWSYNLSGGERLFVDLLFEIHMLKGAAGPACQSVCWLGALMQASPVTGVLGEADVSPQSRSRSRKYWY
jgi:hypothetical protein